MIIHHYFKNGAALLQMIRLLIAQPAILSGINLFLLLMGCQCFRKFDKALLRH